ncbi:MAG: pirin family protein [Bdellovibrionia bacterium]
MIRIRKSEERGHANHGWLDTYHTFSFANYYDPRFTGFRDLLVINEDRVTEGAGFGTHGHENMEIVTYLLEGALEHKDSMGTGSILKPGNVQRMSAGTGVRHSEFNHSKTNPLHLLQIWITPKERGIKPTYEEKHFSPEDKKNNLRLIVSPGGTHGSLKIHQEVSIFATLLEEKKSVSHMFKPGRKGWVQVIRGSLDLNGETMHSGDGASIEDVKEVQLLAKESAEVLLFDLP